MEVGCLKWSTTGPPDRSQGVPRRGLPAFSFAAALLASTGANAADLEGIRTHDAPDHTRVVFDTSAKVAYNIFSMENPLRVVIDLKDTRPPRTLALPQKESDVILRIRHATRPGGVYRIVLDVAEQVDPKYFQLDPIEPYGYRLVVDLHATERKRRSPVIRMPEGERDVVVVVDAGHGGEDPGAVGVNGVREKDIALAVARALEKDLNATEGYRVVMVRKGDYYIGLRQRAAIVQRQSAHLFISIHADSFRMPKVRGATVYALSGRGSSSEAARILAQKENSSDLIGGVGGVGGISLDGQPPHVAETLVDLSLGFNQSGGIEVGDTILRSLAPTSRLHKKTTQLAGFVVLKAAGVPSILIETGFLTNPDDARLLRTPAYRQRLAGAIGDGIRAYVAQNPPPDTLIAARIAAGGSRYVIQRGDTLSEIALRYQMSTRALRAANGIKGDRIRVGQVLRIPATAGS